jgi:hypothetical protein
MFGDLLRGRQGGACCTFGRSPRIIVSCVITAPTPPPTCDAPEEGKQERFDSSIHPYEVNTTFRLSFTYIYRGPFSPPKSSDSTGSGSV